MSGGNDKGAALAAPASQAEPYLDGRPAIGVRRPSEATDENILCDGASLSNSTAHDHISEDVNTPSGTLSEKPSPKMRETDISNRWGEGQIHTKSERAEPEQDHKKTSETRGFPKHVASQGSSFLSTRARHGVDASHETKSVLGPVDGFKAFTPSSEPFRENVSDIGAIKGPEIGHGCLTPFFEDLGSTLVRQHRDIDMHNDLREIARAQSSLSRREIGDTSEVERQSEIAMATLPQSKLVLGSIEGPEAFAPRAEPFGESVCEIGTGERCEASNSCLPPLLDDLNSAFIAEHSGVALHSGLRTEARAHASPSRRKVGDTAYMEQPSAKETPTPPQTRAMGADLSFSAVPRSERP